MYLKKHAVIYNSRAPPIDTPIGTPNYYYFSPPKTFFYFSYDGNYRGYDQGLHFGSGSSCHLDNDVGEVQMKSHVTSGGLQGQDAW